MTKKKTLGATKLAKKSVDLKKRFRAAHAKGMEALQRRDYHALETAIDEEGQIIDAQSALIAAHQVQSAALSRRIATDLKRSTKTTKTRKGGVEK